MCRRAFASETLNPANFNSKSSSKKNFAGFTCHTLHTQMSLVTLREIVAYLRMFAHFAPQRAKIYKFILLVNFTQTSLDDTLLEPYSIGGRDSILRIKYI